VTAQNSNRSVPGWFGLSALLLAGTVLGAVLHSWWVAERSPNADGDANTESRLAHPEEGVVHLTRIAREASGIQTVRAATRPVAESLRATGVVAPDQTRVAHIRPLARGVVQQVHVGPGDRVRQGDKLLRYDNIELGVVLGEYGRVRAEIEGARSNLNVKETVLVRSREMLKVGAVARTVHDLRAAEYRDAQARLKSLLASAEQLEVQLRRFGVSGEELKAFREGERRGPKRAAPSDVLRAPFPGVVIRYEAAEGELIQPDDEVFAIADLSTVWVLADVYDDHLAEIQPGQAVEVRTASYPNEVFRGAVTYVSDVIDPRTRTAKVRCLVRNPKTRLKLEMFAAVSIATGPASPELVVPRTSLLEMEGATVVFVQRSETAFEKRPVVPGVESGDWVAVLDGLEEGEAVVTQGAFALKSALLREQFAGGGHGH